MKKWVAITLLAVVLIGGFYFWRSGTSQAAPGGPQAEPATVARGDIFQAVASTGRVVSKLDVDIKCKASGEVLKLPFDVSDSVKQGDLLVEIDPVDEQRAVDQQRAKLAASVAQLAQAKQNVLIAEQTLVVDRLKAEAGMRAAKAKAEDARIKYQHRKELADQKLLAAEDVLTFQTASEQAASDVQTAEAAIEAIKSQELGLEVRKNDVVTAQAQVDQDKATFSQAEQRLRDTKVFAPMEGTVAARNTQIGSMIASGVTNVAGGTTVVTLSDMSQIYVMAAVDESDIGKVALGQPVRITADAFPGQRFEGRVGRIATKGVNLSNVVTFEVKIEVTSENKRKLKPEMTTNVEIVAAERKGVLRVPASAVTRKEGNMVASVRAADGSTEERPVQVGLTDGENAEVTGGLAEGETVMVRKDESASRWKPDAANRAAVGRAMGGPRIGGGR